MVVFFLPIYFDILHHVFFRPRMAPVVTIHSLRYSFMSAFLTHSVHPLVPCIFLIKLREQLPESYEYVV